MPTKSGVRKLTKREWHALVRFFRREERFMRESFGSPKKRFRDWLGDYEADDPEGAAIYRLALKVIEEND